MKFGSAMLGGDDPDSDIDVMLSTYVSFLTRTEFFMEIPAYLQTNGAEKIIEVREATRPILKF